MLAEVAAVFFEDGVRVENCAACSSVYLYAVSYHTCHNGCFCDGVIQAGF